MKLRYSPTSPYVRKVAVTALETGLDGRIERIQTDVWDPESDIGGDNPLGKVPALTAEDGRVLCDSPLICEYLDSLHDGPRLIPESGTERWRVLNLQALADGILDSAVTRLIETMRRPEALRWTDWVERQGGKVEQALDALEREAAGGALDGPLHLGQIAVGCALAYLDFRFARDDWRKGHPALTKWFAAFSERPSMQATRPAA